tara:strand:- start:32 stop:295 length:264 start_codon:yes stop_codon:yes gene_type:complete
MDFSPFSPSPNLQDSWDNFVRDQSLVLVVIPSVFGSTAGFVPKRSVDEKNDKERVVKMWHEMARHARGREAPEHAGEDFWQVVEMAA